MVCEGAGSLLCIGRLGARTPAHARVTGVPSPRGIPTPPGREGLGGVFAKVLFRTFPASVAASASASAALEVTNTVLSLSVPYVAFYFYFSLARSEAHHDGEPPERASAFVV